MFRYFGILLILNFVISEELNVCNTFLGYFRKSEKNGCWYNPDVGQTTVNIAMRHGYPVETYNVTTKDGYILSIFRYPQPQNRKGVILLAHPATSTSNVWTDKGNRSLAFTLYNGGYEIWMINFRGNRYSYQHVKLDYKKDKEYWDFSFHEMGVYDLPAQVEKIVNVSNSNELVYIGHSMGGTAGAIYASVYAEDLKKYFKAVILLAPAVYFKHAHANLRSIAPFGNIIYEAAKAMGYVVMFHPGSPMTQLMYKMCTTDPIMIFLCCLGAQMSMGFNMGNVNTEYTIIQFSQAPEAFPMKALNHYAQLVTSQKFQQYDYGKTKNEEIYGTPKPPEYPLNKISMPTFFSGGTRDILVRVKDLEMWQKQLPENLRLGLDIHKYNHMDFVYSKTIQEDINLRILNVLNEKIF